MSEREKFEEYMLYGIKEKITLKKCIKNELCVIFFSLLSLAVAQGHIALWLLNALPIILYPIFAIKYKKRQTVEGALFILHNGVLAICLSFIFTLMSIQIVFNLYQGRIRNILVCIIIVAYAVFALLYMHIYKKIVKEKNYNNAKKSQVRLFACLGGILGINMARTLSSIDPRKLMEVLCILCFFASCLTLSGIFNIFKFQYLEKQHKKDKDKLLDTRLTS